MLKKEICPTATENPYRRPDKSRVHSLYIFVPLHLILGKNNFVFLSFNPVLTVNMFYSAGTYRIQFSGEVG